MAWPPDPLPNNRSNITPQLDNHPTDHNDIANTLPESDATANFPVLVQHGTQDPMIPIDRAHETRQRLQQLGVDLSYREYEMQHAISPESLRDLVGWMDEKVLQPIRLA